MIRIQNGQGSSEDGGNGGDSSSAIDDWAGERHPGGKHFLRDLEGLWGKILRLAATVEEALNASVRALCDARADLALEVQGGERAIDRFEVEIERECLRILALYQPVASDLRRVAAVLRINGDLERMADLARHIAKRAKKLAKNPVAVPRDVEHLAIEALSQTKAGLDALVNNDAALARQVIRGDASVDRLHRQVQRNLKQAIRSNTERLNVWLRFMNTARNLERVADHATNIAEAVIYLKEGEIVRHAAAK